MVNFCGVFACAKGADRDRDLSFFRLPTIRVTEGDQTQKLSGDRQRAWLAAIGRCDINVSSYQYTRVSSLHFVSGKPSAPYDSTNPAPSLPLGHNKVTDVAAARHTDRHQRVLGRKRKKLDIDTASVLVELQDAAPEIAETATETGLASQTELRSTTIIDAMQTEIQQLLSENLRLKTDLQVSVEQTKLERDFFLKRTTRK